MAHFKVQLFCSFVPPGIVPTGAVFQAEEELALSEVEGISRAERPRVKSFPLNCAGFRHDASEGAQKTNCTPAPE